MVLEARRGIAEYSNREISEQNAWRQELGSEIIVNPLPAYVTKDVEEKLFKLGFRSINYLPDLNLQEITLRKIGPEAYVRDVSRQYPRWIPFEDLSFAQKSDHSFSRNIIKWFWNEIKNRRIEFPKLPGLWMAVEDIEKPALGKKYGKMPFAEILGLGEDRIGHSWSDICNRMESAKSEILSYIGLSKHPIELRFLEAIEYNLLANRGG